MARMHPEDIEALEQATPGERTVFRFLRETTGPDGDFIGWYEPSIGEQGREPDFVLFGKQLGLLVLEVKDWQIDQIEEADSQHFKVWMGGREENKTNPDRQARGYVYDLMNVLKEYPEFEAPCTKVCGETSMQGKSLFFVVRLLILRSGLWPDPNALAVHVKADQETIKVI
jgi:hypothetical protein